MRSLLVKQAIVICILLGVGLFVFVVFKQKAELITPIPIQTDKLGSTHRVIGQSVEGRNIDAYRYGDGNTHLTFIGGVHGGYEWNTVVLAYQLIDYLNLNPEVIPENLIVTIIPSANPDGVYKVVAKEGRFVAADVPINQSTAPGRFNAHTVDLNRNFDCKWQSQSKWRDKIVSAGTKPFSEPESQVIRKFVLETNPKAVLFWHSQSGAVYASECQKGILTETLNIMNVYAQASGYRAVETFDVYETTGDADAWLASINIPAITVELTTHDTIEWEKNLAGVKALFEYYKAKK